MVGLSRWLLLVVLAGCGCSSRQAGSTKEAPVTVRVRQPARVERALVVRASGTVEARETVPLAFQVGGRVARVAVEEGQAVKRGQLLAELEKTDYELGAQAAEADLAAAEAQAEKARRGARSQEVAQARIQYEQAMDEHNRMRQLFERRSLAENDYRKFEARYRASREQYELLKAGAREEDRLAAEAQSRKAGVNVRLNQKRLSDARLEAPLDAVVLRRLIQPAEMVAPGHPALILGDLNPVRVRVGIPEAEIGKIATGQQATVRVPALGERTFAGTVELVAYAAEPSSRTFAVRILTANPRLELRAGMVAEAEITTGMKQSALTLPGESIIRDPQGVTNVLVYFPEQRQVWTRRVKVGGVVGNEIEVTEGLSEQDEVVVAGQARLRSGSVVTAVRGQQ